MSKTIDVAMTYIEGYFSCYFDLDHYIFTLSIWFSYWFRIASTSG